MEQDRRTDDHEFHAWRKHVDSRLDITDSKLDEILAAFRASKFGAHVIAWLAGLGAAVAVIWANFHSFK
jgi:hypothetical protein